MKILALESDPNSEIKIFTPKVKERSLKLKVFKPSFYSTGGTAGTTGTTLHTNYTTSHSKSPTSPNTTTHIEFNANRKPKGTIIISSDEEEEDEIKPIKKRKLIRLADLEKEFEEKVERDNIPSHINNDNNRNNGHEDIHKEELDPLVSPDHATGTPKTILNSKDQMINREIVEFLNTATIEEIMENFMASFDQANLIVKARGLGRKDTGVESIDPIDDLLLDQKSRDDEKLSDIILTEKSDQNSNPSSNVNGGKNENIIDLTNDNDESDEFKPEKDRDEELKKTKVGRPLKEKYAPETYEDWELFCRSNGMTRTLAKYRDILLDLGSVDSIIKHCDMVGRELRRNLEFWESNSNTKSADSVKYSGYLTQQPDFIDHEKFQLKKYQLIGISWMLMLWEKALGGILADEMGLGKTAQVVTFLGVLQSRGIPGPHLIVVPSSTLDNWMREVNQWCPSLSAIAYTGSMMDRRDLQYEILNDKRLNVVITTYTIATGNSEDRRFLRQKKFKSLFLDEGHMIKNGESQRAKNLKNLKIPFKILITGTPLQNNLSELLSLLTFIMPELFEPAKEKFMAIFDIKRDNNRLEDEITKRRLEYATRILAPFILRRKKEDVRNDIPPKNRTVKFCQPTESQLEIYREIMQSSRREYLESSKPEIESKKKKTKKEIAKSQTVLSNVLMQLRKAANHQLLMRKHYNDDLIPLIAKDIMRELEFMDNNFDYIVEDMKAMSDFELHRLCVKYPKIQKYQLEPQAWMDTGKVKYLEEVLPVMRERGDKVLLFSQFVIILDILEFVMKTLGMKFLRLDGSTPGNERMDLIDEYNNNPEVTVFLLSTKACGLGINLTSANTVILYDIDFNPHNDNQAEDRAHRVGQKRPVEVIKLISEGTVEKHMLTCANFKLLLDDKVQEADNKQDDPEADEGKVLEMLRNDMDLI